MIKEQIGKIKKNTTSRNLLVILVTMNTIIITPTSFPAIIFIMNEAIDGFPGKRVSPWLCKMNEIGKRYSYEKQWIYNNKAEKR